MFARDAFGGADQPEDLSHHQVVVLFGATGDLARRKLLPGLARLSVSGLVPDCRVVATSLDEMDDATFRALAHDACRKFGSHPLGETAWEEFAQRLSYVPHSAGAEGLSAAVGRAEDELGGTVERLHYLSIPPAAAGPVARLLADAKLVERSRIILEKPFGTDLAGARRLNAALHEIFEEDQIFRIDHFLGKEAAQNILAFRFANGLFEPIWNRNHIDHVQIDVPETLDCGGRAGFYEGCGAYRDMVVTHLFQVLAFMAMEPPAALEPSAIAEEKNKVFRSLRPIRRSSRCGWRSTTGGGPVCRSTCVPARTWPKGPESSPSPSGNRPGRCSRRAPASGRTVRTT
jgi:glucose-6-phosphate 1-dehydrogenase